MDQTEGKLLLIQSSRFFSLNPVIQEEIFHVFYDLNYGSIFYVTHDHHATEDIIQEAFLKTIYKSPDVENERQLIGWIKVTVRNLVLNYLRKIKNSRHNIDVDRVFIKTASSGTAESVESQIEAKLLEEQILQYLSEMKPEYRFLIELRWKFGLSYHEIAQELHITDEKVRQKLHRARDLLKNKLLSKGRKL
ncbi:RNA polymerase sigma factor [Paenibacillus riograndensis]|uniref:RNA polymerase, sigma-24 subunit, ECF subfamily protein n=1 Tax=Paenibacillus riograndensis SBR5 TaxID=1073571 RepID=A0A0E4HB25_9BACL|nr:sigma-70 family RNA polymerase sigma factor [Paenibacillus riograndensis]CQR55747.1 RNA polymerase, sigma-24 subunit, ECF subfamily protein [Paenibacillus riograndensis SBR5]